MLCVTFKEAKTQLLFAGRMHENPAFLLDKLRCNKDLVIWSGSLLLYIA